MFLLMGPSKAVRIETKGAPMTLRRVVGSVVTETTWALGVGVAAGLLLLS
jgi:hypothetical protein